VKTPDITLDGRVALVTGGGRGIGWSLAAGLAAAGARVAVLAVNVTAVAWLSFALLSGMLERGWGNVFRPGSVDTALQAFIRDQDPEQIGAGLHQRFVPSDRQGALITPGQSAAALLARLPGEDTGQIWTAKDPLPAGDPR
jgi:hypothetical protein